MQDTYVYIGKSFHVRRISAFKKEKDGAEPRLSRFSLLMCKYMLKSPSECEENLP